MAVAGALKKEEKFFKFIFAYYGSLLVFAVINILPVHKITIYLEKNNNKVKIVSRYIHKDDNLKNSKSRRPALLCQDTSS